MRDYWIPCAAAAIGSILLTPLARALALRCNAVDRPDGKRKLHRHPVPCWGGIAVYLALVLGLISARWLSPIGDDRLPGLALVLGVAAGVVCIFGCIDDRWNLSGRFKLLLQVAAVLPVVVGGYTVQRVVAFGYPIELGWLGVPVTIFWLVGCINALNLLDGMDGLASVVGATTGITLALVALSAGQEHVALLAMILAGALAGFLVYNLPPASIFLGDSGSMVIGLVVGLLGIQGAMKTSATLSITAPAVVMSIPMLDTVLAIVRRELTGQRFFTPDRGHIHHRLLDRGLSNWQALCMIGALCLTTGAAATAATIFSNDALAWITLACLIVLLVRSQWFGHHELSLVKLAIAAALGGVVGRLIAMARLRRPVFDERLTRLPFEESWSRLTGEARRAGAAHVRATFGRKGEPHRSRDWFGEAVTPAADRQWSMEIAVTDRDGAFCQLSIGGLEDDNPRQWWGMARLLRLVARHWASDPERFSRARATEAETPAPRHAHDQSRRAAA